VKRFTAWIRESDSLVSKVAACRCNDELSDVEKGNTDKRCIPKVGIVGGRSTLKATVVAHPAKTSAKTATLNTAAAILPADTFIFIRYYLLFPITTK
jgi:hypothetical protein